MNKPYICHNCGTDFDAYPDPPKPNPRKIAPSCVKVKCPGCYANGYQNVDQMIYTLDITGDATLVR